MCIKMTKRDVKCIQIHSSDEYYIPKIISTCFRFILWLNLKFMQGKVHTPMNKTDVFIRSIQDWSISLIGSSISLPLEIWMHSFLLQHGNMLHWLRKCGEILLSKRHTGERTNFTFYQMWQSTSWAGYLSSPFNTFRCSLNVRVNIFFFN